MDYAWAQWLDTYVNTHTFYFGFVLLGLAGVYHLLKGNWITAGILFWASIQFVHPR